MKTKKPTDRDAAFLRHLGRFYGTESTQRRMQRIASRLERQTQPVSPVYPGSLRRLERVAVVWVGLNDGYASVWDFERMEDARYKAMRGVLYAARAHRKYLAEQAGKGKP